jgi:hypothetical protein
MAAARQRRRQKPPVAVVNLPEEDPGTFQDVLSHVYPRECCHRDSVAPR